MTSTEQITISRTVLKEDVPEKKITRTLSSRKVSSCALTKATTITETPEELVLSDFEKRMGFVTPIIWTNVILITLFHMLPFVWGFYVYYQKLYPKWQTFFFELIWGQLAAFGVTGGVHRLWTHRSYKATIPLQIFLMFCYSIAGQNTIHEWVRDHRVHHKYSDANSDPHNVNRGFFFSHVGWLMTKKHPDVLTEGKKIDMSDIVNDPLIQFHTKYFTFFKLSLCFVIPILIPVYYWGENWNVSIWVALVRYIISLNSTWSINSFAHTFGNKPYDKGIRPTENWITSVFSNGEGWHNYHHTFPWDYKAAELPYKVNSTTLWIDMFKKIGWAYDTKVASSNLINAVMKKRGVAAGSG